MTPRFEDGPLSFIFEVPSASNTLFLDRDGVLNEAVIRSGQVSSPRNSLEFVISSDISALSVPFLTEQWNLIVVTNQPDLTRGLIDFDILEKGEGYCQE